MSMNNISTNNSDAPLSLSVAALQSVADQQKKPVSRPMPSRPAGTHHRVLHGKRGEQGLITAIPRRIRAFVSRLAKDTTTDDLTSWLNNVGIVSAKCSIVVPKDGRVFQTSAFHVSCDVADTDKFYDESNWLQGSELRDWVFYKRTNMSNDNAL